MKKEKPETKLCKYCKSEIAYDAKVCPQCRKKQSMGCLTKILIFIVVIIVLLIFGGMLGDDEDTNTTSSKTQTEESVKTTEKKKTKIPTEYLSALKKAQVYSDEMYMSKQGIYDQLISEYGEQFDEDAATYAMKHIKANWKENALKKAKEYQKEMSMSKEAIRDQLVSEHGEKFTQKQADYAIEHLD